jgi:ammonia channel protein AmtB
MSSGWAALAFSLYLGKRRGYGTERLAVRPSSVANVVLGTALLWFGWFDKFLFGLCDVADLFKTLQRRL